MATVSSALKTFTAMQQSLKIHTSSMYLLTESASRLQGATGQMVRSDRSLLVVKQQMVEVETRLVQAIEAATQKQEKFNRTVEKGTMTKMGSFLQRIKNAGGGMNQAGSKLQTAGNQVQKAAGGAGKIFSSDSLKRAASFADNFLATQARLKLTLDEGQTLDELQTSIYAAAQRSGGDFLTMADIVGKLGVSDAFADTNEMVSFAELMQKGFRMGGASVEEQAAGMEQMSKAMMTGTLKAGDFQMILEKAPMLAEAVADSLGKSKEELANSTISADLFKSALFSASEEIDGKYREMPRTFGSIWNEIANTAMIKFAPFFEKLGDLLNNPAVTQGIAALGSAFEIAANVAIYLLDVLDSVFSLLSGWSAVEPIIWGIVAALTAYKIVSLASAAAQWLLNSALLASPITWVIALVTAIFLVVEAINHFAGTSLSAMGVIAGAIAGVVAFLWNTALGLFNALVQLLWTGFVEPWIGIVEWVLNVFHGGFNSFGDAVKHLLGQIISWFLSLGKVVTKIIDAIFGTNWTDGLTNLQDSVLQWGKNEKAITLDRKAPVFMGERIGYGKAWNAGYKWGESLNLPDSPLGNTGKSLNRAGSALGNGLANISRVDEVGRINDTVDIASEDLKMMRELAEMKAIQNFVTLTPTVQITGDNHFNSGYDIETIIARINQNLEQEIASSARMLLDA